MRVSWLFSVFFATVLSRLRVVWSLNRKKHAPLRVVRLGSASRQATHCAQDCTRSREGNTAHTQRAWSLEVEHQLSPPAERCGALHPLPNLTPRCGDRCDPAVRHRERRWRGRCKLIRRRSPVRSCAAKESTPSPSPGSFSRERGGGRACSSQGAAERCSHSRASNLAL